MSTVASETEVHIPPRNNKEIKPHLQPIENQPKCPANHSYVSSDPSNQESNNDPANIKKPKSKKFNFIPETIKNAIKYENN